MSDDDKTTTDKPMDDVPADDKPVDKVEEPKEDAPAEEPTTTDDAPVAQSSGTDQQGRELFDIKCDECGGNAQVPFKPSGGRPVYCRECYMKNKQ